MESIPRKNRVLFIGPYPPPFAGPEMGMKLFLESSLVETFNIIFLKTNVRKTNEKKGRFDLQMILAFFRFIIQLTYYILRYRPDAAYYPNTATQTGWIGRDIWCLFICRIFKVKTVIHLRGGHLKLNFQKFNPLAKKIVRLACRSVSLALVQAECLKDQYEGLISADKIKVMYNAIDTREYNNDDLKNYERNSVLFMGHMTQAKGYCDVVRAIPLVLEKVPAAQFYFAGTLRSGENNVFFNQLTGLPLEYEDPFKWHASMLSGPHKDNYNSLGVISGDEKKDRLRRVDVFILPSYSEGFSRSILEAMSMGKPVICTPVGAHGEVIHDGKNGFIIVPGNVEQLADRIVQLLTNPLLRQEIVVQNYQHVRETFDIHRIALQLEEFLYTIIREPD